MNKQFEVLQWTVSGNTITVIIEQNNHRGTVTISRKEYEVWLETMDKLWYEDAATGQPWKCTLEEYWRAHASYIQQNLYGFIAVKKFLKDTNIQPAVSAITSEYKQQMRIKELCTQLRDLLANTHQVLNDFEDSVPVNQHNGIGRITGMAQDIKACSLRLMAVVHSCAVPSDTVVNKSGILEPKPENE